jgi:serine/threonine protein kinase
MENFDINKLKIKKKLGSGVFGTTYLAIYKNKEYAYKIQKILKKHTKKNYNYELWRELEFYNFINNKLNNKDKVFFTNLYYYRIYNNCKHDQKNNRPFKIENNSKNDFSKRVHSLDKSKYCVDYLTDYHGDITLDNFFFSKKRNIKEIYSIYLQIYKIMDILYNNNYTHNDIHGGNIMVKNTKTKNFSINGKNIPYYGNQLVLIDYGEVMNKNINLKNNILYNNFKKDSYSWFLREFLIIYGNIYSQIAKQIDYCQRYNKKLPWEYKDETYLIFIQRVYLNETKIWIKIRNKYLPIIEKINKNVNQGIIKLEEVLLKEKNKDKLNIFYDKLGEKSGDKYGGYVLNNLIYLIIDTYYILYPEKFKRDSKWCKIYKPLIPKKDIFDLFLLSNSKENILSYLLKKMNEYKKI